MAKSDYEDTIIKLLKKQRRPLSTFKIARKTDITWPTAKKHLNRMKRSGLLSAYKSSNRIFWKPKKKTKRKSY